MKRIASYIVLAVVSLATLQARSKPTTLRQALKNDFYIGTALNRGQYLGTDENAFNLVPKQFSAIVAENCMKSEKLQPYKGVADRLAGEDVSKGFSGDIKF